MLSGVEFAVEFLVNNDGDESIREDETPIRSKVQIMVNILVSPEGMGAAPSLEKLCCVGEYRDMDSSPTITKPLNGSELAALLSPRTGDGTCLYLGREVRRIDPSESDGGKIYKINFEFDLTSTSGRIHDTPNEHYFGVTLLMLNEYSKQSVTAIKYSDILQTWFQHEVFHPIAFFDTSIDSIFPTYKKRTTVINNDASSQNAEKDGNETTKNEGSVIGHGNRGSAETAELSSPLGAPSTDTSVLSRLVASAPIFTTNDDLSLASWIRNIRQAIHSKMSSSSESTSALSLKDLGFQYETPAVYKDATKTFLSLFSKLLPARHVDQMLSESTSITSLKEEPLTKDSREKLFEDMRRDVASAFLRNKLRVPISVETATILTIMEAAKSYSQQPLSTFDSGCATSPKLADDSTNESTSLQLYLSESKLSDHNDSKFSVDCSSSTETSINNSSVTAIDFLTMVADYFVQQKDPNTHAIDSVLIGKKRTHEEEGDEYSTINKDDKPPSPSSRKRTKVS